MHRVGVMRRAAAVAIDGAIALVIYTISGAIAFAAVDPMNGRAVNALFCSLWLLYTLMEVFGACSLGKLAVGIRIADSFGQRPRDGRLLLRWSTKYYWMLPGIFDYFVPGTLVKMSGDMVNGLILCGLLGAFNDDGLAWHDQWSGTSVVRRIPAGPPTLPTVPVA